jgi:O-acetyl-ADP-ribose deacetylase (regulator of RNase III)
MIVNAANSSLVGGGGVDGAIHSAAGRGLVEECELFGGCETGETRVTGGYDVRIPILDTSVKVANGQLPARMVAHTVGPVYRSEKDPAAALKSCYASSLYYCKAYGGGSIAFSSISTGICESPFTRLID